MKLVSLLFALCVILAACSSAQAIPSPTQASSSDLLSNSTAVPPTTASVEANPTSTLPSGSAGQPSSTEGLVRMDEQGAVTVEVKPVNLTKPGETIEFEVGLNTHSVDLSMDLASLATLTTDTGKMVQASQWDAPPGGHHVSGKLIFPATVDGQPLLDGARTLTLTLQNLDVPERLFSWDLTP